MAYVKSSKNADKSTYFTFLGYPDTLPDDWKIQLAATGRPIAISPLHDSDRMSKKALTNSLKRLEYYYYDNRAVFSKSELQAIQDDIDDIKLAIDGKPSKKEYFLKPHYHIIYIAKNPVTADAVRKRMQNVFKTTSAVGEVKIIATSVRNMYDYLTHESVDAIAKKKHIYDKKDIVLINNFDIDRYDTLDVADKKAYLNTVLNLVKSNGIQNMIDLEFFIDEHGSEHGLTNSILRDVVDGKSGILRLYFDGNYQRSKRESTDLKKENEEYFKLAQRQMQEIVVLKRKLEDKEK